MRTDYSLLVAVVEAVDGVLVENSRTQMRLLTGLYYDESVGIVGRPIYE